MDKFYDKLIETIDNVYSKIGLQPTEIRCNDKLERRIVDDYFFRLNDNDTHIPSCNGCIFGFKVKNDGNVTDNTFRLVYEEGLYKYDSIFITSVIKFVDVSEVE